MSTTVSLHSEALRCDIAPALGGCIAGLWWGDIPVLRSTPAAQLKTARQSGSYPLVPFSNRVSHAVVQWQGTSHPLVRNNGEEAHAIHGVGWQRPWHVLDQDATSLLLSYEHKPDSSWPFAFDASQTFLLHGAQLTCTLSITNQDTRATPVGLGWHPYFVKRPGCRLAFEAQGRWEMGADKLPTHRVPVSGVQVDGNAVSLDHCFDGWTGAAVLHDELLTARISASVHHLVVYTQPDRDVVAVEPVSHVNNALNMLAQPNAPSAESLGVHVLQPGASLSAHMTLDISAT